MSDLRIKPMSGIMTSMVLVVFLFLSCFGPLVSASSSVVAWRFPSPSFGFHDSGSISDLLVARGGTEPQGLVNARRIIQDLSASLTCAHGPTVRLLKQCKAVKSKHEDAASEQQLENSRSAFAITMALCEARQARITAPSGCNVFDGMLETKKHEHSVEIVRQDEIERCAHELFRTNSLWTSYTGFKNQAADLCDSSRFDYQREELLEHFRQATNVIPDILDALKDQQQETQIVMASIQKKAVEIAMAQQNISQQSQYQAEQAKAHLEQISTYVEGYVRQMDQSQASWQTIVAEAVKQASTDLTQFNEKTGNMQQHLAEIYASAGEAVTGIAMDFESKFELMARSTNAIVEQVVDLGSTETLHNIRSGFDLARDAAADFKAAQAAQWDTIQAQLDASEQVLHAIKHSSDTFEQITNVLDMIPGSWIIALHNAKVSILVVRKEVEHALVFLVPALMLWSIGYRYVAQTISLIFLFLRALSSTIKDAQLPSLDISLDSNEVKFAILCFGIAACAGTAIAFFISKFNQWQAIKARAATELPFSKPRTAHARRASTISGPPTKGSKNTDRSVRALSVPMDMP